MPRATKKYIWAKQPRRTRPGSGGAGRQQPGDLWTVVKQTAHGAQVTQEVIHGGAEGRWPDYLALPCSGCPGIDQVDAKEEEEQQRVDVCAVHQAEEEEAWEVRLARAMEWPPRWGP